MFYGAVFHIVYNYKFGTKRSYFAAYASWLPPRICELFQRPRTTNEPLGRRDYGCAHYTIPTTMLHNPVTLRRTKKADLALFFHFQLDQQANYLAAFTSEDSTNKEAYLEKFTPFLSDPTINMQTILVGETIVGSIAKFEMHGHAELTYWLDRNAWGQGIATAALSSLLAIENTRPLFGRVAFDNVGSQRVLEKCGFVKIGTDKGFAHARQAEIEEFIYQLS